MVNAWWLAEAALLAYADKVFISETFKAAGLTNAGFIVRTFEKKSTQCFVAHNDKLMMLVFRGTELDNFLGSVMDWATNFKFIPVDDGAGGLIHQGFHDGFFLVWDKVKSYLKSITNNGSAKRPLWITGHSMGAALATLAADKAVREGLDNVKGVYTFGSPRVGDSGFKDRFLK